MIIATVNSKGGVGKTTLAVHLAVWLELHGWKTALVDCDAQRLSSWWLNTGAPSLTTFTMEGAKEIDAKLPNLGKKFHAVVVDAPGGLGETTGAILAHADAAFIPTGPSHLEITALEHTTATVHEIQKLRSGLPQTVVIPIRATAGRRTTRHLMERARGYGFGVTKAALPYREIYLQVSGLGNRPPRLLWQLGKSRNVRIAALEMDSLFQEIFPEACESNPTLIKKLVSREVQRERRVRNVEQAAAN